MVVNDVPGEECRIAILRDGRLDDLFAERTATATSVGNIYKGRVTNVEQAIQAAFIDFGHAQKGFLHYSDLHPRYFPDGEKTEKVGKKTSRRERPPLQKCLKRGDEVLVQVIKEGIGTKGPTLTSYLSIPGRLMADDAIHGQALASQRSTSKTHSGAHQRSLGRTGQTGVCLKCFGFSLFERLAWARHRQSSSEMWRT